MLCWATSRSMSPVIIDRKSTRLNSSHVEISYAVFCLKKKKESSVGRFIVGLQRSYPELEHFLRTQDIPYVDLSNSNVYPRHAHHCAPHGHVLMREKIK